MRKVVEQRDPDSGFLEFHMVKMDSWNWYDYLRDMLVKKFNANLIKDLDGIWMRVATLQFDEFEFKLMFHEDIGNYLFSELQSELAERRLREVVSKLFIEVKDVESE